MPEVPPSREHHRQAVFVRGGDHLGILHRSSGLNDRRGAGLRDRVKAVPEREERVGRRNRTLQSRRSFHHRHLDRIDSAHLPGANRECPVRGGEDDRVRLDVRAHAPGKAQRRPLVRSGLTFGYDPYDMDLSRRSPRRGRRRAGIAD